MSVTGVRVLGVLMVLLGPALHKGEVEAVRCYVCSSLKDPDCKDPFQTSLQQHKLTHCNQENLRDISDLLPGLTTHFGYHSTPPQDFACVKAVTREHGREVVVRSCTVPSADTFDVCSQLKSRDMTFCKTCTGDSCNGSPMVVGGGLGVLLPAVTLLGTLSAMVTRV